MNALATIEEHVTMAKLRVKRGVHESASANFQ